MYGVEKRFKMQLLLGLKGSPLVGARIVDFVTPDDGEAHRERRALRADEVLLTWPLDRLPKQLFRDFEKSSFHRVNRLTH